MCNGIPIGLRGQEPFLATSEYPPRVVLLHRQTHLPDGVLVRVEVAYEGKLDVAREHFILTENGWLLEDAPCTYLGREYLISVVYTGEQVTVQLAERA